MIEAKEIGIKCIKFDCHNKSNQELENYIYTFQDLMYFYNGKQITIQAKEDILKTIETIGSKVKDIECDEKVEPRKQEFLTNMRKIYKNVRNTSVGQLKKEDVEYMQKLCNYSVALSIKAKQGGNDIILKQLEHNKKVWNIYIKPFMDGKFGVTLGVGNFCKIQKELLQLIGKKYDFDDE